MTKDTLPSLEYLVQRVVEKHLAERDSPAQLSTETVRQWHEEVHLRYSQPGRTEMLQKGSIKNAVRRYLEREYAYIQEYVEHHSKPGKRMIVSAHYERKKKDE